MQIMISKDFGTILDRKFLYQSIWLTDLCALIWCNALESDVILQNIFNVNLVYLTNKILEHVKKNNSSIQTKKELNTLLPENPQIYKF